MFIGHYGVGLGLKKTAPVSLGLLFLACQFLDLLWPTFLLLNIEYVSINNNASTPVPLTFTDYPYSHSLVMAIVWSVLFGGVYWLIKRNKKYAFILGLCVLSHWVLDLIVHLPDLPLYPSASSPKVGLQLWTKPIASTILESFIFIVGLILYLRSTKAKNKTGSIVFWILIVLLILAHMANLLSPPPTSVTALAWGAQFMWIFVILAFWADNNRTTRLS
jgi:FtsH-binding integral membrane protein